MSGSNSWQKVLHDAFENAAEVFCEYCGTQVTMDGAVTDKNRATIDHRIPRARGGTNLRANLAICCYGCNQEKAMLTEAEFRAVFRRDRARKHLLAMVLGEFRPEHAPPITVEEYNLREQLKEERRIARYMGRLTDADPECERCDGRGEWRRRGKRYPCVCRVLDLREREAVRA